MLYSKRTAMDILQWVNAALVAIGIPTIVLMLVFIGRKLETLDRLELTTEKIKHNLKVVCDHLTSENSNFNHTELEPYSPLKLSDAGRKFVTDIGFDEAFSQHQAEFFAYIDGEEPKLKYDVELAAIRSISAFSDKDYMQFLKIFLYNNPDRKMENVTPTLGVLVRDAYLAKHPEITQ